MATFFERITGRTNGNEKEMAYADGNNSPRIIEIEKGNMHQLGYTRAGRNQGDPSALSNSFSLIKSGQIVNENNNEQRRKGAIETLDKKILEHRGEIAVHQNVIDKIDQVDLPALEAEIIRNKERIERLRIDARTIKYDRNQFNMVLTWIGFIAGFIYLYLFYVSAIHSALFRNIAQEVVSADKDSIGQLLNNVFNVTAFKEFNIHWFAPIIFFIFALVLHFSIEIKSKLLRIPVIGIVVLFVLVADGLLAYCIENNNHTLSKLMGLSDGTWVVSKSIVFYLVLFFGFFTSIGWSLVLHKLANEFEASNPEKKAEEEIRGIEKNTRQLFVEKGNKNASRVEKLNLISSLEAKIKTLEASKTSVHYSLVDLERSVDDFFGGWLSYLNGLQSSESKKNECQDVYDRFKATYFNRTLTA